MLAFPASFSFPSYSGVVARSFQLHGILGTHRRDGPQRVCRKCLDNARDYQLSPFEVPSSLSARCAPTSHMLCVSPSELSHRVDLVHPLISNSGLCFLDVLNEQQFAGLRWVSLSWQSVDNKCGDVEWKYTKLLLLLIIIAINCLKRPSEFRFRVLLSEHQASDKDIRQQPHLSHPYPSPCLVGSRFPSMLWPLPGILSGVSFPIF